MSAVLRAAGDDFDVEAYLRDCTLPGATSYKRGDPVFPRSQPGGRRHQWSGVHAEASPADFDEFRLQVADATRFLSDHADEIRRLRNFPGVEAVTLDFGIWRRDVYVQCDHFPSALVRIAGSLDVGLELSVYSRDAAQ
jgi:hypothetical protein